MSNTETNGTHPKRRKFSLIEDPPPAAPPKPFAEQLAEQLNVKTRAQERAEQEAALELAARPFPASKGTELLDLELLVESPNNPRQVFEDLESLAASIKATGGLLVPIVAREITVPGEATRFEIVAGARRFRALQLLNKQGLPWADKALVDIRKLTDAQVAEAMMAENDQRDGLKPLEQALGYKHMLQTGFTVDTIAEKLGVSKGTVHARLKLLELGKKARAMLLKGALPPSVATPLARYPEALQAEALEQMLGDEGYRNECYAYSGDGYGDGDKVLNARNCIEWLQENFTKSLKNTPFDPKDERLPVPTELWPLAQPANDETKEWVIAPGCGECPRNSRNLPREVAGEDLHDSGRHGFCTLPACFKAKWDATLERLRTKAKQTGELKVLSRAQSEKALKGQVYQNAPYAKASEVVHDDPKKRTWGQLLEVVNEKLDATDQIRKVVATTEEGKTELVEKTEVLKVLAADGVKWAKAKAKAPVDQKAAVERERAREGVRREVALQVLREQVRRIRTKGFNLPALRAVVDTEYSHLKDEELEWFEAKNARELEKWIEKDAAERDLVALLYMRVMSDEFTQTYGGYSDEVRRVAEELKLDLKELEKEAKAAGGPDDE